MEEQTAIANLISAARATEKAGKIPAMSYGRISSVNQEDGYSLDAQAEAAVRYAEENNLEIVYEVSGVESAHKQGRPNFNKMLEMAKLTGVKHLIFKDGSRVTRNWDDGNLAVKLIQSGAIVIHMTAQRMRYDRNMTAEEDFFLRSMIFGQPTLENQIRSRNMRNHHARNRKRGVAPHAPRFGYEKDPSTGRWVITSNTEEESWVRYIFDKYDKEMPSLQSLADHLNEREILTRFTFKKPRRAEEGFLITEGRRKWRKQSLNEFLTNPFWHGEFREIQFKEKDEKSPTRIGEIIHPGTQDTYYDKDRFLRRMERMQKRNAGRKYRSRKDFRYKQLLVCSCGRRLSGQLKKGTYILYTHNCEFLPSLRRPGKLRNTSVAEERIDQLIEAHIRWDRFSDAFAMNLKTLFAEVLEQEKVTRRTASRGYERQIQALVEEKDNLFNALAKGLVDDAGALNQAINQRNRKIEALRLEMQRTSDDQDRQLLDLGAVIDTLRDLPRTYLDSPPEGREEILRALIEGAEYDPITDTLKLIYKRPFCFVMKPEILDLKGEAEQVRECPTMLPRLEEIRKSHPAVYAFVRDWGNRLAG